MLLPPLAPERARRLAGGFAGARILIVGDAMLDTFIAGRVTRISPEAPVPVVAFDHETHRLGGAANVAHNVAALGGRTSLVAVTGQDEAAARLARACRDAGIEATLVADPARPTTTKVRIVTERNQQVARVDYENDAEISPELEAQVVASIEQRAADATAIVVSDYLKGCITPRIMESAVRAASRHAVPLLVDPKIPHIECYAGATIVTPNHHEAETATHMRVRSADEARTAARAFRDLVRCEAVLMTRGDQGMWLLADDVEGHLAASAREVADVTGAGDTVIATLALALAAGATVVEASWLANEAAGIAVGKFGAATVTPAELLRAVEAASQRGE
jgi:D-beta-D-heptose 7-phosphate kinase/D-beta-D-heptose 1-phosphate adenosyltransferase